MYCADFFYLILSVFHKYFLAHGVLSLQQDSINSNTRPHRLTDMCLSEFNIVI